PRGQLAPRRARAARPRLRPASVCDHERCRLRLSLSSPWRGGSARPQAASSCALPIPAWSEPRRWAYNPAMTEPPERPDHDRPSDPSSGPSYVLSSVPLFPLPNVVLFPRAVLPLHIFEERYKEMTAEALAGDRQVAMALLKPGWEKDYYHRPVIEPVVC